MCPDVSPGLRDRKLLTSARPFGYKTAWFAIRSVETKAIANALQLQRPEPANWEYGISHSVESDDYSVFVTPPVNGWTLAVGLPILFDAEVGATGRLMKLSRQFGEAQLFASMRISDAYLWAMATDGRLVRRFYEGDSQREETGEQSEAERALGKKFFDASSPDSSHPDYWKRTDLTHLDEGYVLLVAGQWSLDPSKLHQLEIPPALGLLGEADASYPPRPSEIRRSSVLRRIWKTLTTTSMA